MKESVLLKQIKEWESGLDEIKEEMNEKNLSKSIPKQLLKEEIKSESGED